ncbi:hypothetical protein [Brevundimonas sp.]|uniref:hypothetical protein n=1 Tax=Brevundimonas sp. TaxID=1871086 RepID=UPI003D0BB89F
MLSIFVAVVGVALIHRVGFPFQLVSFFGDCLERLCVTCEPRELPQTGGSAP